MHWPWQRRARQLAASQRLANAVVQEPAAIEGHEARMSVPRVVCIWPDVLALDPTQRYGWCRCGLSANGLWCDGSHRAVESSPGPLIFSPKRAQHYWLCTCKQTRTPPYCDASHHRLRPPSR